MEAIIESQNARIRKHLESGKSLTPLDALYLFSCWALSSRISDLHKQGMNIKTDMIEITSEGKTKRVAKYRLAK
jgi:hypothetical protein